MFLIRQPVWQLILLAINSDQVVGTHLSLNQMRWLENSILSASVPLSLPQECWLLRPFGMPNHTILATIQLRNCHGFLPREFLSNENHTRPSLCHCLSAATHLVGAIMTYSEKSNESTHTTRFILHYIKSTTVIICLLSPNKWKKRCSRFQQTKIYIFR